MDLSRFPRLPLWFFFQKFPPYLQRLMGGMLVLILLAGLGLAFHSAQPYFWSLEINTIPQVQAEEVQVMELEQNYRSIPLKLNAFRQWTSFSAGPIEIAAPPFYAFLILQFIAWSMFLAAASLIRSNWAYLFYAFFALFFHFSGLSTILYPAEVFKLLEFLMLISYLGLAYLFQAFIIRWELPARFLSILGLSAIYIGLAIGLRGWEGVHEVSVNTFGYLAFVSLLLFLFLGKEPTNLLFYAGTNHPQREKRWPTWVLVIGYALLAVVEFVWLNEFMNFNLLGGFRLPFRPSHLLIFCALVAVFTSQNHFTPLKKVFESHSAFSFLLMGWVLAVLSYLMVQYTTGDPLFIFGMERLMTISFLGVGFAHLIYVIGNFGPLLKQKFHIYYLLPQGPRFGFGVVWMIGLISLTLAEGQDSWKSFTLLWHAQALQEADHATLLEDREGAIAAYEVALLASPPSPKANYNLASLYVPVPDRQTDALRLYQLASKRPGFPFGWLNAAQLLQSRGQIKDAQTLLGKGIAEAQHPYLLNNLGLLLHQQGQGDSAIQSLKSALLADLEASPVYSNLAQVYWEYEKVGDARQFFEASLETPEIPGSSAANALAFALKEGMDAPTDWTELLQGEYFAQYNHQLSLLKAAPDQVNGPLIKQLANAENAPDAMLLDGVVMFLADSVDYAASRIQFLSQSYPQLASVSELALGALYHGRDVPEMAFPHFLAAGEAGDPLGTLYAGKMLIDLGQADSAYYLLSALRAEHEALWDPCAKEFGMLLVAYGQEVNAMTEWDVSRLSFEEQIRVGRYADSTQEFAIAVESFRRALEVNPESHVPYWEMGRLYNRYHNRYALDDLNAGLTAHPEHPQLLIEYARALLYQEQTNEALAVNLPSIDDNGLRLLQAELALAQADTATALSRLQENVEQNPMDQASILLQTDLLLDLERNDEASLLITQALDRNDRNPDFWHRYARCYQRLNLPEDAGFGAVKAIELSGDAAQKAAIAEEFAEQIRLIASS